MSYSGPPGVSKSSGPAALPARPPAPITGGGFRSTFTPVGSSAPSYSAAPSTYSAAPSAYPGAPPGTSAPPTSQYGALPTGYGSLSRPPSVSAAPTGAYGSIAGRPTTQTSYQTHQYGAPPTSGAYATPPSIRNPFPTPGSIPAGYGASAGSYQMDRNNDPNYDPEMAAQIAQWNSAYVTKESEPGSTVNPNTTALGTKTGASKYGPTAGPTFNAEAAAKAAQEAPSLEAAQKTKTVYREGGGKKWADDSLMEWDPAHIRLFVGNLAGETTDDSLLKAFARWGSVQKAKVVRDKRTNKSKGFGFVSFSDPDDFFQAAKEMNGKYIQSHPVVVRRSTTEIKQANVKPQNDRHKGKKRGNGGRDNGHHSGSGSGGGGGGGGAGGADGANGYEPYLGPVGGGIVKPGQKTKGGLKLLG